MHGAFRACSHAPSHATRHPGVNFNFPIPTHPALSRCASLFDASTSFVTPHAPPPASTLTIHPLTLPCMVSTTLRSWVDNLQPTAPLAPPLSRCVRHLAPPRAVLLCVTVRRLCVVTPYVYAGDLHPLSPPPLHAPHPSLGRVDNRPPSTTPARYGSHGTYASVS